MKKIILITACLIMAVSAFAQQKALLTIVVENVDNSDGRILVGIFNKRKGCFEAKHKFEGLSAPAQQGSVTLKVELPLGDYVLAAMHDIYGDGRMHYILGIPREQYGFSNNVRLPIYEDAVFTLVEPMQVTITLR